MSFERYDATIGRYRARYLLGQGGMASVYLAQALGPSGFERWVALKAIHAQYSRDERFVRMFLDEARVLARLYHPNVCTVFDSGEADGTHYIAMEYLHGEPLNLVAQQEVPLELATRIVVDAARGLHAAHELRDERGDLLGLVHRDVSPHNIIVLYEGVAKVVDFGVARARDRLADSTTGGSVKGKLAYMAPEQIEGEAPDRRTDVFGLGVVLWEATVGWRLFKRATAAATMRAALDEEVPLPSKLKAGYPRGLERVVMKALERDRSRRWETMQAFADALEELLHETTGPTGAAQVASWMRQVFRDRRREREAIIRAPRFDEPPKAGDGEATAAGGNLGRSRAPAVPTGEDSGRSESIPSSTSVSMRVPLRRWRLAVAAAASAVVLLAAVVAWLSRAGGPPSDSTLEPPPRGAFAGGGAIGSEPPGPEPSLPDLDGGLSAATSPAEGGSPREGEARGLDASAPPPEADGAAAGPERSDDRPRFGYLNVMSVPVAEVWVGSRRVGTTPLRRARVRAGRHVVRLRSLDSQTEKRVVVRVQAEEITYLSLDLAP